ncbi:formate dehydrogenase accessory sulfurtransferase FdhD [uncultured Desulfuromonas sp.]|uniref:formate dehydrogenase accessory sulfurtransferase FdhD n=1 Tax=uncultured Desulfuromonas sp. TaxID=181013 RepID=UPI0026149009|nr:formate dehydrogenase accessory sulfurtransferase FdhD [uncultured Desulfuromonas sp.]
MMKSTYRYEKGRLVPRSCGVVEEFPVRLKINGKPLATLVASPHRLNFLIAGFLRLQGFVDSLDDVLTLGVCADFGYADVRLKTEVPENLAPTLTSGCGTGISFNLDLEKVAPCRDAGSFSADEVFALMRELGERTERYRSHGGIHSAAVGDRDGLLLYAEDIGRHNTLDRIAGEALFKGIDLRGRMLVTSGRVSTEMVAKAARLGVALIASRTSPTDRAIELAEQAGICLLGYVRGQNLNIYSHPERLALPAPQHKIAGVTGVILAGGESSRMGSDKSLLPIYGARFIDHVYRTLDALFEEVIIVTNSPDLYSGIDCRKVPDIYYAQGSLAGIHSGLCHARSDKVFVAACDMPFLNPEVVRSLCERAGHDDVVIPVHGEGAEPLHALYSKACIAPMKEALDLGKKRIISFFPQVTVDEVDTAQWRALDPEGLSLQNINTPEEYYRLRDTLIPTAPRQVFSQEG